ncbi:MAG TPA: metallophosphoesterase [Chitinophagaceae bacterium]|nr:metallophosphoesterase [Chitinophagaceae bacterium]
MTRFRLFYTFLLIFFNTFLFQKGLSQQRLPVTNVTWNDDTSDLHFAIITDLWGGRRPGIFEDAVAKLNLLQPQFVISVGDLIDGKSYDSVEINRQWNEFDRDIAPLQMPFFYVPGNHDISNEVMEKEWRRRMGQPYYHFVFKNVLFLCINTEDGGSGGIKKDQVAYFKKAIEENKNVRWTFLFMHRPVWQGKGQKQEGYEQIESLLEGRQYTLFSGHHHTYLSSIKNGKKHFVLGSTGGGSDLRGEKYGEYDHITLVSLTKKDPVIVNLKLDGIIKEDIVDDTSNTVTQCLINGTWLKPLPVVADSVYMSQLPGKLVLHNELNIPLKVTGSLASKNGIEWTPSGIDRVVNPGTNDTITVVLRNSKSNGIRLDSVYQLPVELTGAYLLNGYNYSIPFQKEMLLSWKRPAAKVRSSSDASRRMKEGKDVIDLDQPELIKGPWYWTGKEDSETRFQVSSDGANCYVNIEVKDNQWIPGNTDNGDAILFYYEDKNATQHSLVIPVKAEMLANKTDKYNGAIKAVSSIARNVFQVQCTLPLSLLKKADNSFRINLAYRDEDKLPKRETSVFYWKPLWSTPEDYMYSGVFLIPLK